MNKIVKNFFVGLLVFAICSCAQTQPVVRGSFAPGVFIKNRLNEAGNFLNTVSKVADGNVIEDNPPVQPVVESKSSEIEEQKNVQKIPGTSIVHISAGDKKRKYLVVK